MLIHDAPDELIILLGRILAGFGDVEFAMQRCVGAAIYNNTAATRALFRLLGSDVRLNVADALMRPAYDRAGMSNQYNEALGATRYSKSIRNQYAHAHWVYSKEAGCFFTSLEKEAKKSGDVLSLDFKHVDWPLLHQQKDYLIYSLAWWYYLCYELQLRQGKSPSHTWRVPKIIAQPPLHNPQEKHPLPPELRDDEPPPTEAPPGSSPT
jgi:hypothetical protein